MVASVPVRRPRLTWTSSVPFGWAVVLVIVLLWPVHRSGYPLGRDMVFTPRQYLGLDALGLSGAPPRAAPVDTLVALVEYVVNGAVVGRLALVLPLLAVALGVARLLAGAGLAARVTAIAFAVWNPYVAERLAIGQWPLLWAYAALPWIVLSSRSIAVRGRGWTALIVSVAACSIVPTGGVVAIATAVTMTVVGARSVSVRRVGVVLAITVVAQLTWILPALFGPAGLTTDPLGVAAFAARADQPTGLLASLLTGGGIWDTAAVPSSRDSYLSWIGLAVVVLALIVGTPALARICGRRTVAGLAGLGVAGLLVALLPSLPGGARLMRWALANVPGAGLLRDGQKWIMFLVLFVALTAGAAVQSVVTRVNGRSWTAAWVVIGAVLPIVLLPDAAATVRPVLAPAHYSSEWTEAARIARGHGSVVSLPFTAYRSFSWAPGRGVLDPAPRTFDNEVIVSDALPTPDGVVRGEDPRARAVAAALAGPDPVVSLEQLGVGWVLVAFQTPDQPSVDPATLAGARLVLGGRDLDLYRLPDPRPGAGYRPPDWLLMLVLSAYGVWLIAALTSSVVVVYSGVTLLLSSAGRFRRDNQ